VDRAEQKQQPECQLKPDGAGGMTCARCAVACDIGDTPPACLKLTFSRMRASVIAEAERIEASSRAAVAAGFRRYRDKAALQTSLELHKLAELIDRCTSDSQFMSRMARTASKPKENNTAETQG
jgi:hypothetical protein